MAKVKRYVKCSIILSFQAIQKHFWRPVNKQQNFGYFWLDRTLSGT